MTNRVTGIAGANAGANDGSHPATFSHSQQQSSQLDGLCGYVRRLVATLGSRLAADGFAGDHDRPLGRVQHERRARVDLNEAYGGPLIRARAVLERDESPAAFEELLHPLGAGNWVPGCAPGGARVGYEHDVGGGGGSGSSLRRP